MGSSRFLLEVAEEKSSAFSMIFPDYGGKGDRSVQHVGDSRIFASSADSRLASCQLLAKERAIATG